MQRLPTEILLNIYRSVNRPDLKSLRLASKRLNLIAASVLFKSVNASPHTEDLKVLELISGHPDLCQFVQEVVYFEVYFHLDRCSDLDETDEFPYYRAHQIRNHYPKQTKLLKNPTLRPEVHVKMIARALSRMPNLRGVILRNHWCRPRDYNLNFYHPIEQKSLFAPIYGPRTSRYCRAGEPKPYGTSIRRLTRWHYYWHTYSSFDYGFSVMCRALSISKTHLQSFSVDYLYQNALDQGGLFPATFLLLSSNNLKHACNTFQSLHKISLTLDYDNDDDAGEQRHCRNHFNSGLAKMLAAAENLEELILDFNYEFGHLKLEECLGTRTWSHLSAF
jgi:hypothetical protein